MAERGRRDPERERFWRRTIGAWERSGQTVRAFCESAGVSQWSFYSWRRQLRERDGERKATVPERRRAKPTKKAAKSAGGARSFLPVMVASSPPRPGGVIELEHRGTTIRVSEDVETEALVRVLEAVGRASC